MYVDFLNVLLFFGDASPPIFLKSHLDSYDPNYEWKPKVVNLLITKHLILAPSQPPTRNRSKCTGGDYIHSVNLALKIIE